MKKLIPLFLILITLVSCGSGKNKANKKGVSAEELVVTNSDGSVEYLCPDMTDAIKTGIKVDDYTNVIQISGDKITNKNIANISIAKYAGYMTTYSISCYMKVVNKNGGNCKVNWFINDPSNNMPSFFEDRVQDNTWVKVTGELDLLATDNKSLCLSIIGTQKENLTVYLRDFRFKAQTEEALTGMPRLNWMEAESVKEKYADLFEYVGLAVSFNNELNTAEVMEGLERHFSSITMGNEFKPDFVFNWKRPIETEDFKAEDGKIYQMPKNLPDYGSMPLILAIAQSIGVKMRGHVLVWHNQTPLWFFKKDFANDNKAEFVDKATMNARLEWYIKSVLTFVRDWERENNDDERIVTIWDVVNEAVSDGAGSGKWLREDSNWFRVYGSEEFIINAFRYANKYAPKEVRLVYNDYNTYQPNKCAAICNLVDEIRSYKDARIDAVGMQAHVKVDYPELTGGSGSFEYAVQKFIDKGVDVQVTELDIANGNNKYSPMLLKNLYKQYYELFIRNRKTSEKNGIMGVTIWGVTDGGTWLNALQEYSGHRQYPLLFNDDYTCKPAFYGVLEAADSIGQ